MAVIVGTEILPSNGQKYELEGLTFDVANVESLPAVAVPYVKSLLRGAPMDDVVQTLLEDEGTFLESWHRKIGYWAGCINDKFSETEWTDEFDSQRDSRLLEDEFLQGGDNDVD